MKNLTGIQKIGIFTVLAGCLIGIVGAVWVIYSSFAELYAVENAGIGPIGYWITVALISTCFGLLATVIGVILVIFGGRWSKKK